MNWFDATKLASPIRRTGWVAKWIFQDGIWWMDEIPRRVVTAADVTAEDLRATDWTNLTVEGVPVATKAPVQPAKVAWSAVGTPAS